MVLEDTIKRLKNPESRQLYDALVSTYQSYLQTFEPKKSGVNRFFKMSCFKAIESCRQLAVPLVITYFGTRMFIGSIIYKQRKSAERELLRR